MDIRPIKTDEDHDQALREIERLWGAAPGTSEGDKLDVLATLVEAYENTHWPIEELDPIETIQAYMEMAGLTQVSLAGLFGSRSRASEVLGRKRALSMDMIFRLNKDWHIPAETLIRPYHLNETTKRSTTAGRPHAARRPGTRRAKMRKAKSA